MHQPGVEGQDRHAPLLRRVSTGGSGLDLQPGMDEGPCPGPVDRPVVEVEAAEVGEADRVPDLLVSLVPRLKCCCEAGGDRRSVTTIDSSPCQAGEGASGEGGVRLRVELLDLISDVWVTSFGSSENSAVSILKSRTADLTPSRRSGAQLAEGCFLGAARRSPKLLD